jgi:non-homologous end joining protein Ku
VEPPEETKVVDLMEALKQSVEATQKEAKPSGRKASGRKKAAS